MTVQLAVGITQQQKSFEMRVFFSSLAFVFDAAHLFIREEVGFGI